VRWCFAFATHAGASVGARRARGAEPQLPL